MDPSLFPTTPARPVAPYLGGKHRLATRIIERIAAIPHATYAEPFVGMGGVFLRRPFRARCEVLNDLNGEVANLFRILQRHFVPFMDELKWRLTSRAEFDRLRSADPGTLTDLERAARFLYLQRLRFSGKHNGVYAVHPGSPGRFDITRLGSVLEDVHERLAGVIVEQLPYADLLRRYDRAETFFYIDPPYWRCEGHYGPGLFERSDFARLAAILAGLKGRFIMSLNDTPEVRELFGTFEIEPVELVYTAAGVNQKAFELLISGPLRPS